MVFAGGVQPSVWVLGAWGRGREQEQALGAPLTCLLALPDALPVVGDALSHVAWAQDVALVARGAEEWLCPVLCGAAGLCCGRGIRR